MTAPRTWLIDVCATCGRLPTARSSCAHDPRATRTNQDWMERVRVREVPDDEPTPLRGLRTGMGFGVNITSALSPEVPDGD